MKNECSRKDKDGNRRLRIMMDVAGMRAKMYSYKAYDPTTNTFTETRKAKGIQKQSIEGITHQDNIDQLEDPNENRKWFAVLDTYSILCSHSGRASAAFVLMTISVISYPTWSTRMHMVTTKFAT